MALNRRQRAAAEMAAAQPTLSGIKIAALLEIDVNTFYRWKKNPEWQEYMHKCCQERFRDLEKLAVEKLADNVKQGNQKAIEYVLDYVGYLPEQKLDISGKEINIKISGDE